MIESPHGSIEYDESGTGPTVVLVPGSCSTGAVWRPIMARWEKCFRCVTTSLLGYGRTAERRTSGDTNIDHEADILEAVVLRAGGPVHLVGHSFGGLTALAAALRHRVPLLSLVIIEAPAADVRRQAEDRRHCRTIRDMTQAYFSAFESGEEEAIQVMIDFFSGPGTRSRFRPLFFAAGKAIQPYSARMNFYLMASRMRHWSRWRGQRTS